MQEIARFSNQHPVYSNFGVLNIWILEIVSIWRIKLWTIYWRALGRGSWYISLSFSGIIIIPLVLEFYHDNNNIGYYSHFASLDVKCQNGSSTRIIAGLVCLFHLANRSGRNSPGSYIVLFLIPKFIILSPAGVVCKLDLKA